MEPELLSPQSFLDHPTHKQSVISEISIRSFQQVRGGQHLSWRGVPSKDYIYDFKKKQFNDLVCNYIVTISS